ncbi:MAG: class I SAM-dependent RNA methyltransferase [Clostridia bacterium]|nr:class I SAM-dependent RNA methyltransferase [Clostridia bacterium]
MRFFITTPFSMERPVRNQVERMDVKCDSVTEGRVYFSGDVNTLANVLVNVRAGDRVYWEISSFEATSFDELFDNTVKINWADIISVDGKINVSAKCARSIIMSVPDTQRIVKKAIVTAIQRKVKRDKLSEKGEEYPIDVHIHSNKVTVAIDCAGTGLHKRGYRVKNAVAPLRETFASGLIEITGYRGQMPFIDTFCGSGTLPIEAAMKALNIAPGMNRSFAAESFKGFNKSAFDNARSVAKNAVKDIDIKIFASDISPEMVDMARYHAMRAGVDKKIEFSVKRAGDVVPKCESGILLTNPPYGERIGDEKYMQALSLEIGDMLNKFSSWNRYVLSGYKSLERYAHIRAEKCRRFYNGNIECNLYNFFQKN